MKEKTKSIEIHELIHLRKHFDIIAAGGDVAGIAAAISAKYHDKKILIIEKSVKFNGLATLGLENLFVPIYIRSL